MNTDPGSGPVGRDRSSVTHSCYKWPNASRSVTRSVRTTRTGAVVPETAVPAARRTYPGRVQPVSPGRAAGAAAARRPDTFVVGAPKCGTTTLYSRLASHPDVFACPLKEPNFFGRDLPLSDRSEQEYLALFAGADGQARLLEASAWYLRSTTAAQEIARFSPQARVVVALRNPVDMMFSLHGMRLFTGEEDLEDFAEALERDGEPGRRPPRPPFPPGVGYVDAATLSVQVARFLEVFGRERTHVVVFDDLRDDPVGTHAALLRFLGLDDSHRPGERVEKQRSRSRSAVLRDVLRDPPGRSLVRRAVPARVRTALWRDGAWKVLYRLNAAPVSGARMDPALRERLLEQMRPEIEALGRLVDRDLVGLWCDPSR